MKRTLLTALCTTLVVAMTVPALADHRIGGYFRERFIMADLSFTKDGNKDPDKLIDQRLRMRWQNNLNEYVSVVWYGEVDFFWGGASKGGIGGGGQFGGDGVNVETKNALATVKIPETPVSVTVGLQNFNDSNNLIFDDDMAGAQIHAKMDMVDLNLQYAKLVEGDTKAEDDIDLWGVEVGLMPMAGLKLALNGYWKNNNTNGGDLYWVTGNAGYKMDMFEVDGTLSYNFGQESSEVDVKGGLFGEVHGAVSIDGGMKLSGRFMFFSGTTDKKDANYYHGYQQFQGGRFSHGIFDGLMIFDSDITTNNYTNDQFAYNDAGFSDHGLLAGILTFDFTPPAVKAMYLKAAAGYFSAVEDKTGDRGVYADRKGKNLGGEIALRVGYKIAERFDVSLNGAYAMLGDFYDKSDNGKDPDNPYKLYAMINVPY